MTVQNQIVKNVYVGNGSTTVFPFTFAMDAKHPEYIKCFVTDTGSVAGKVTDFTVDTAAKTVTYPATASAAKLTSSQKLTVYRSLPVVQLLNLVNQGPFFAEDIEQQLDDIVFICQQLEETFSRCLTFSVDTDAEGFDTSIPLQADKAIKINSTATGFELTEDPAQVLTRVNEMFEQIETELDNLQNTNVTELKELVEQARKYALVANQAALTNVRYIVSSKERDSAKDDYGLSDANLYALPENLINIKTTEGS